MLKRLLPREISFFGFFAQHSRLSMEACTELDSIASNPEELETRVNRIKEIEHKADEIAHKCIDALHQTFITPIDRTDIQRLIKGLDDVVDAVDSAAARMMMYEMSDLRPELKQFTEVLVTATYEINRAIHDLPDLHQKLEPIERCCAAIYRAEKEGDQILRAALTRLFKDEKEPILVIKWKEIFERLEKATDRCEEVGNIIQGIVIESS